MAKSLLTLDFGKHRGEDIEDVPLSYLEWLDEDSVLIKRNNPEGHKAVLQEIKYRKQFVED